MEHEQEAEFAPGTLIANRFVVEATIGKGAMGTVYRARHSALDVEIALKVLHPHLVKNQWAVARFLEEARAVAALKSDNVARVLDTGKTPSGVVYLALEFVAGRDLEAELREVVRLPVARAVRYALDVCAALAEAHGRGIVHRDLKPENMLVERRFDGVDRIKLIDFGVAKRIYRKGRTLTLESHPVGTPSYMAPEQILNSATVDGRADIFSLGVILYEMLSGYLPFGGASTTEAYATTLQAEPAPLAELIPEVSAGLAAVVHRCLEKKPEDRFPDVGELAQALARFGSLPDRLAADTAERAVAAVEVQIDTPPRRPTSSNPTSAPVHTTLVSDEPLPMRSSGHGYLWMVAAAALAAGLLWGVTPSSALASVGQAASRGWASVQGSLSPHLHPNAEDAVPRPSARPLVFRPQLGTAATEPTRALSRKDGPPREAAPPPLTARAHAIGTSLYRAPLDPRFAGTAGAPALEPDEPQSNDPQSNDPQSNEPQSNEPQSDEPQSDEPQSDELASDRGALESAAAARTQAMRPFEPGPTTEMVAPAPAPPAAPAR